MTVIRSLDPKSPGIQIWDLLFSCLQEPCSTMKKTPKEAPTANNYRAALAVSCYWGSIQWPVYSTTNTRYERLNLQEHQRLWREMLIGQVLSCFLLVYWQYKWKPIFNMTHEFWEVLEFWAASPWESDGPSGAMAVPINIAGYTTCPGTASAVTLMWWVA